MRKRIVLVRVLLAMVLPGAVAGPSGAQDIFWIEPPIALANLPDVTDTIEPRIVARQLAGSPGLPARAGDYVFYVHGDLWYWFGPFESRVERLETLRQLRTRIAALRAEIDAARYAQAFAIQFAALSDTHIADLYREDPDALRFKFVLDALQGLDRIVALKEELEEIDPAKCEATCLAELLATSRDISELTLSLSGAADPRALGRLHEGPDGARRVTGLEAAALRREVGLALLAGRVPGGVDLERLMREGVLTAEAIAMSWAARDVLVTLGADDADIGVALSGLAELFEATSVSPVVAGQIAAETIEEIAALALREAAIRSGLPRSAADGSLAAHVLETVANDRTLCAASPDACDELKEAAETTPDEASLSDERLIGPSAVVELVQAGDFVARGGEIDRGIAVLEAHLDAAGLDATAAAALGLSPPAARAFGEALTAEAAKRVAEAIDATEDGGTTPDEVRRIVSAMLGETAPPGDPAIKEAGRRGLDPAQRADFTDALARETARATLASELRTSLAEQTGTWRDMRDAPTNAAFSDALADALESRNAGKPAPSDIEAASTRGEALDAAAQALAETLVPDPDAGPALGAPGLTGSEVAGAFGEVGRRSGGNDGGGRSNSDRGGDDGDLGSGNLPLPGSAPLFEFVGRILANAFGIDIAVAKQVLMVAYMLDPEGFERLADQLSELEDALVPAEVSVATNDVNKVMEMIAAIEAQSELVGASMNALFDEGIGATLQVIAEAKLEELTNEGAEALAKELGVDPRIIRGLLQVPSDFDPEALQDALLAVAKVEASDQLQELGLPGPLSDALAAADFDAASALAEGLIDGQVDAFLERNGLHPSIWDALKNGDMETAAAQFGVDAERIATTFVEDAVETGIERFMASGLEAIATRTGISADRLSALSDPQILGDPGRLQAALKAAARAELEAMVTRQGLPEALGSALLDGDAAALDRAVRSEGKEALAQALEDAGVEKSLADRLAVGDVGAASRVAQIELVALSDRLSREAELPPAVASALADGRPAEALETLARNAGALAEDAGRREVERHLTRLDLPSETISRLRAGEGSAVAELFQERVSLAEDAIAAGIRAESAAAAERARQSVANASGLAPESLDPLIRQVSAGDFDTVAASSTALARAELVRRLEGSGLPPEVVRRGMAGDLGALASGAEAMALAAAADAARQVGVTSGQLAGLIAQDRDTIAALTGEQLAALDQDGLLSPSVRSSLAGGRLDAARDALVRDGVQGARQRAAQALGLPTGATLADLTDRDWLERQARSAFEVRFAELGRHVYLDDGLQLAIDDLQTMRQVTFEIGRTGNWASLATAQGMDETRLKRFAQSVERIDAFGAAAREFAETSVRRIEGRVDAVKRQLQVSAALLSRDLPRDAR